jgi:repressor LexA
MKTAPEEIKKIVQKLRWYFVTYKRLPSYNQLADYLGYSSKSSAYKLVQKLIKLGYIKKDDYGNLIPDKLFTVPLLGSIPAGYPVPVDSPLGDSVDLYEFLRNIPKDLFCLIVKGDSMQDAGIIEGDLAYINPQERAKIGDIVAACVDGEWTLKYYAVDHEGNLHLKPANKRYKPIYPKESLIIGGVLFRSARDY